MENALLIGLSRQMVLRRQMDVLANNMANVNTAGYKRDNMLFEEYVMPVASISDARGADAHISFVQDPIVYRDFDEGPFEPTGNELDVAISGDAWFVVQTPDGERYTRNGQLKLSPDGELVTPSGHPILGEGGPITIGSEETGIEIASDGTLSTNLGPRGKLRLVRFEDNGILKKEESMLFSTSQPSLPAEEARIAQGVIEKSNVEPVVELSRMIETVRAYTSLARALDQTSQLRQDAIDRLGGAGGS